MATTTTKILSHSPKPSFNLKKSTFKYVQEGVFSSIERLNAWQMLTQRDHSIPDSLWKRLACGISPEMSGLVSAFNNRKERQITCALSHSSVRSGHHETQQSQCGTNSASLAQFILSWNLPGKPAGPMSVIPLPPFISFPLPDLPHLQREVLAFGNPHTSKLSLIYDVFILPRPPAVSLSND